LTSGSKHDLFKRNSFAADSLLTKAAEARYTAAGQVDREKLKRWLAKARDIQWDYKNLIRRKGRLQRLK